MTNLFEIIRTLQASFIDLFIKADYIHDGFMLDAKIRLDQEGFLDALEDAIYEELVNAYDAYFTAEDLLHAALAAHGALRPKGSISWFDYALSKWSHIRIILRGMVEAKGVVLPDEMKTLVAKEEMEELWHSLTREVAIAFAFIVANPHIPLEGFYDDMSDPANPERNLTQAMQDIVDAVTERPGMTQRELLAYLASKEIEPSESELKRNCAVLVKQLGILKSNQPGYRLNRKSSTEVRTD